MGDLPDPHSSCHSALMLSFGLNPQNSPCQGSQLPWTWCEHLHTPGKKRESHCKPSESCQQEAARWTWSLAASNQQSECQEGNGTQRVCWGSTSEHPLSATISTMGSSIREKGERKNRRFLLYLRCQIPVQETSVS